MKAKCLLLSFVVLFLSAPVVSALEKFITQERHKEKRYAHDPLAVKTLSPTFDFFPDSSLVDFSYLLDPPAGKQGFVLVDDAGHFHFEKTKERARFWGVTVTQEHIDIPHYLIDQVVEALARAGVNLVRFHAFDNRAGEEFGVVRRTIIDEAYPHHNDSRHFEPDYWDRLDYWIAKCKERGIYVYLVLRGYRTFREGDGVVNADQLGRAARPYAMFNRRLIELQKEYADNLLFKHINPYATLSYANDPAVAFIEIFNEDSLFMRPHMWQEMTEPYRSEFRRKWNEWLLKKYGSTEELRQAWTNHQGEVALQPNEKLEDRSVKLPQMNVESFETAINQPYTDPLKSPVRRRDAVAFAIDLQETYFGEIKTFLKAKGLKVPLTGVVHSQVVADTFTVATALDFTAENAYYEHPIFEPGKAWRSTAYYKNKNYLTEAGPWSLMPFITRYKWHKRPLITREWATCWPNEYRAASILETAAYALFQDLDAMIFFAYYTTGDFTKISDFNITSDPARWGLFGLAAKMFLSQDVAAARHTIGIGYSQEDLLTYSSYMDDLNNFSWCSKLENMLMEQQPPPDVSLIISSGRSHKTDFKNANQCIIYANNPYVDNSQKAVAQGNDTILARAGYELETSNLDKASFIFDGFGFDKDQQIEIAPAHVFDIDQVKAKNYKPIGVTADGKYALGFYDRERRNLIFGSLPKQHIGGFAADLLGWWYDVPYSHEQLAAGLYVSDTTQLRRNTKEGTLIIDTPAFQTVQGTFNIGQSYEASSLKVVPQSPFAVIAATALDDKPLASSKKILLKMVTIAHNRNQRLEPSTNPEMPGLFVLANGGVAPVQTKGEPSQVPTIVHLNGKKLLEAYMVNGSWELLLDMKAPNYYLACDSRNIRFRLFPPDFESTEDRPIPLRLTRYYYEIPPPEPEEVTNDFIYPAFIKYIKLEPK